MPSIRLTLVNNAKQTQRSGVILKLDDSTLSDSVDNTILQEIFTLAKNKLRLKKAKTLFLTNGVELTDPRWLLDGRVAQDSLIYVSCGEGFVGTISKPASSVAQSNILDDQMTERKESASITVLARSSYVDPESIIQLNKTALLPGMQQVIGQPDLHPGNLYPIGASFITHKYIYPALIGNDIGCGMAFYKTKLSSNIKPQKIVDRLHGIEGRWQEGDPQSFLTSILGPDHAQTGSAHSDQLGTVGGGNHFAEFVIIEKLVDQDLCANFGLTESHTYLIVHSGSRRFGQTVLEEAASNMPGGTHKGIEADSDVGRTYLEQHDRACAWARVNRELIAHRVLSKLNSEESAEKILDIWHNNVERKQIEGLGDCWVHRKGAAPSDRGLVVIPGSRGHHSYLVMPQGSQNLNGFSLAHGAGRLLPRAKALQKRPQASKSSAITAMQTTDLGSSVICEDTNLLFEEQPAAYKDISAVITDLEPFVKVIAILRPICTYKMRKEERS
ncbi:hypothetical protein K7432_003533 [Basidiobolus ranarum]|uniref:3'-phosphate/5'-hydroxy nucleic acid ligase n=1 Tax=Basidiobolus ranarum TaxID=34480 RepID=A0ABR2WZM9_9FUNG